MVAEVSREEFRFRQRVKKIAHGLKEEIGRVHAREIHRRAEREAETEDLDKIISQLSGLYALIHEEVYAKRSSDRAHLYRLFEGIVIESADSFSSMAEKWEHDELFKNIQHTLKNLNKFIECIVRDSKDLEDGNHRFRHLKADFHMWSYPQIIKTFLEMIMFLRNALLKDHGLLDEAA